MKLKPAILSVLGRDQLKHIVDDLKIDGVDRRHIEGMKAALSRARRVGAADLFGYMQKNQITEIVPNLCSSSWRSPRATLFSQPTA